MRHLFLQAITFYCCACVSLQASQTSRTDFIEQKIKKFKAAVVNLETVSDRNITELWQNLDEILRLQYPEYRAMYEALAVMQSYQEDSSYCTWPLRLTENTPEDQVVERVLIERLQDEVEKVWPKRK